NLPNFLFHTLGDGKFEETALFAGTALLGHGRPLDSMGAERRDYDNDGLLDLFVTNYSEWTPEWDRYCGDKARNIRVYCHPKYFKPLPNQLYHNLGDGTFEEVSERAGLVPHRGRGMGIAFADYDDDGLRDVFVTNDNLPNFLFHNLGDGKFEETALFAGTALLSHGKPVA
ncbi:MAG: VCBS repeat-containing protein, partial [bacterium]|nr:VCBS repeat-containing protein [bacterium]